MGVLGTFDDITERKQAELDLRESKNRLEMAMEGAQLGSWDWELPTNRTVVDARYEKMLGFAPGELAGEHPTRQSNIHPDDMAALIEQVAAYAEGKTPDYSADLRQRANG